MLILTRKSGQGFRIGDDIEITITEVSGDKVRVGIDAPKEVKVLRSELTETMAQNLQAAGKTDVSALRALARGLAKPGKKDDEAAEPAEAAAQPDKPDKE